MDAVDATEVNETSGTGSTTCGPSTSHRRRNAPKTLTGAPELPNTVPGSTQ